MKLGISGPQIILSRMNEYSDNEIELFKNKSVIKKMWRTKISKICLPFSLIYVKAINTPKSTTQNKMSLQ
jgi:hypothetical protein